MVRTYSKKRLQEPKPPDVMKLAVAKVLAKEGSIRQVAIDYGIDRMTLSRYVKKGEEQEFKAKLNTRQVFTTEQESQISEYLIKASKMNYSLSKRCTRKLAYEYGMANNLNLPASWKTKEIAGSDWLDRFMQRQSHLSLRAPEATSLSRATSFNKTNVGNYYDNLHEVMTRRNYQPQNIYNVDETGVTTVQRPNKVIAEKGVKQVGRVTSAERGTLVTVCGAVNAIGNSVPPLFVFPRVNFKEYMIKGAPVGSIGTAHPSGWMTAQNFVVWIKHFVQHSHASNDNQVLLVMDNHDSHTSIEMLDYAKSNGVTIVTFPPHCSHKLQPLDRTVYGPFKRYFNTAADAWMTNNPGKPMTIYDLAELVGNAYPLAFSSKNIQAGFKVTGIVPFDRDVFW